MADHVKRVHDLGMKYILWYSVPYIGVKSKIWDRFKDMTLYITERNSSATLDPRYKEVREYLINIYIKALQEWDIDGFKLDFVDRFGMYADKTPPYHEDMDYISVDEAVDALLSEVIARLSAIKPDIMIEFRQRYIGPLMRKYGNMFRVADCPMDYATNRAGICDLRLLSGSTAVHSDMIMWYQGDQVESAALQINNILFGVPQISVKLETLTDEHEKMLTFWLAFFEKYQQVRLDGTFIPHHPELFYPIVEAQDEKDHLIGIYADQIVTLSQIDRKTTLVNGKLTEKVILDLGQAHTGQLTLYDCCGKQIQKESINWTKGTITIAIPKSGIAIIQ